MALFWLVNPVIVGTTRRLPGDSINDAVDDAVAIRAAGGLLWPQGDPTVDAAAADCVNARINRGSNEIELESIMQSAVNYVQQQESAGQVETSVATLALLTSSVDDLTLDDGADARVTSLAWSPFVLYKTSTAPLKDGVVIATKSGTGRWHRKLAHIPKYTDQVTHTVNTTGSIEAPGTLAQPVRLMEEITRRLQVVKYGPSFGPYVIQLQSDIPNTDSFQLSCLLESIAGNIGNDPDSGVTDSIININGTKTIIGSGTVSAFVPPVGNAKCTLTRAAGAFALNDIIEFTSGASIGRRTYPEVAGATTTINPNNLGGTTPAPGDTFNLVQLTKLAVQINGILGAHGSRVLVTDCWIPGDGLFNTFSNGGAPQWELQGMQVRFNNCLLNQFVRPGLGGGRVRIGGGSTPSAVICPASGVGFYEVERESLTVFNSSIVNTVIECELGSGRLLMGQSEVLGGALRGGAAPGSPQNGGGNAVWFLMEDIRSFDVPAIIPANPYYGSTSEPGRALILHKDSFVIQSGTWVGTSPAAGTKGLKIDGGSKWLRSLSGTLPTVTGAAGDLDVNGGAAFPHVDATNAIVVSALTSWTGAGGFNDVATFNGSVVNLRDGTTMGSVP